MMTNLLRAVFSPCYIFVAATFLLLLLVTNQIECHTSSPRRANILLLITDDQDVLIGGIDHMPLLNKVLRQQGAFFENAFVHTPICCPSRSSILSGRYLHNGLATNNSLSGNCNGLAWQQDAEQHTFAVAAHAAGYQTAYAGKYLNQYGNNIILDYNGDGGVPRVPPGWDHWMGLVGNSQYYDYKVVTSSSGGKTASIQHHSNVYSRDYLPDLVANQTLKMIHNFASTVDDSSSSTRPFLITAAWPTPHAPFTPAPQDQGQFAGYQAHRTPNFNATKHQNAIKHWMMRRLAPVDPETEAWIDHTYQLRNEALLTIDRHIELFVNALNATGQLDNTFIIYTSDNGFQLGQHRIQGDKRQLYEHDIRVPLLVRGPGIPAGVVLEELVLNIDLAPTITEITTRSTAATTTTTTTTLPSLLHTSSMDGESFLSLLLTTGNTTKTHHRHHHPWRHDFLVSYHGEGGACGMWTCPPLPPSQDHGGDATNNTYHCVRTMRQSPGRTNTNNDDNNKNDIKPSSSENSIYCHFDDDEQFIEYYDLESDPWQLYNAAMELSAEERFVYETRLEQLKHCQGESCRKILSIWEGFS